MYISKVSRYISGHWTDIELCEYPQSSEIPHTHVRYGPKPSPVDIFKLPEVNVLLDSKWEAAWTSRVLLPFASFCHPVFVTLAGMGGGMSIALYYTIPYQGWAAWHAPLQSPATRSRHANSSRQLHNNQILCNQANQELYNNIVNIMNLAKQTWKCNKIFKQSLSSCYCHDKINLTSL